MKSQITILFIFLSFALTINAQIANDSLYLIWKNKMQTPANRANAYNRLIHSEYLNYKADSAYIMAQELLEFAKNNNLMAQQADALITLANSQKVLGDMPKSLDYYQKSLNIYEKLEDKTGLAVVYTNIGSLHNMYYKFDGALEYHKKSLALSEEIRDTIHMCDALVNIGNVYNNMFKLGQATDYYLKSLKLSKAINYIPIQTYIFANLGDNYRKRKKFQEAIKYYKQSLNISELTNNINAKMQTLYYISGCYLDQKNYNQSINYARMSLKLAQKIGDNRISMAANRNLFDAYKGKNDLVSALKYLEESISLENSINEFNITQQLQQLEIEKIRMRDSLLQIEKEIKTALVHEKEIQQKNKENTDLTLAWGGSLSSLSILAFLIFRNTKRKQRKAEEERQEQIEEKEKILKHLELSTIDAMIQGQEKERERLAADLHDSVGATLVAAKLQFDYLIKNQNDAKYSKELVKKTSTLLEDAYVEIRSMAHLKNSGVMAKNGLLPAVEKLSFNASGINGLTFEVQSFGLEQRLENSLEISIFRIIQELVTNIIKHANATKGIVHLTNHDDNLNIMIEDNGVGFNPKQITKTNIGMGINSIDKRVEHLEGQFTIESEKNKGTTVIIDIPL